MIWSVGRVVRWNGHATGPLDSDRILVRWHVLAHDLTLHLIKLSYRPDQIKKCVFTPFTQKHV